MKIKSSLPKFVQSGAGEVTRYLKRLVHKQEEPNSNPQHHIMLGGHGDSPVMPETGAPGNKLASKTSYIGKLGSTEGPYCSKDNGKQLRQIPMSILRPYMHVTIEEYLPTYIQLCPCTCKHAYTLICTQEKTLNVFIFDILSLNTQAHYLPLK